MKKEKMKKTAADEKIAVICKALQTRNYADFVELFAEDALFEIPFTVNGGTSMKGLATIRAHFANIAVNLLSKLIQIEKVNARTHFCEDDNSCKVEYFTEGLALKTQTRFSIQSSIAVIKFEHDKIVHYKDFPNTLGISNVAGVLLQVLESIGKSTA